MTTSEMAAVMMAYEHGKKIEFKGKMESELQWRSCEPLWNWIDCDYRVKPEPKYVPYDNVTEVEKDKWVKSKSKGILSRIVGLDASDSDGAVGLHYGGWCSLKELFEYYTYEDGTPCGKLVV